MKLLTEYLTAGEAELAASTLEAAGIATFVSNSDSAKLPVASSYAGGIGLWVVVDEQLWDAEQLLDNPDHEVRVTLTEEQRREIHSMFANTGLDGALGLLFRLLGLTVLLFLVVFVITRL
ncbi:MAG: hypothetical protein AAFX10_09890 [Pseudomonadota bacterium]